MNKVHSIVWSKAQNAWVVVAEGTKAVSKAGGAGLKVLIALIMLSPVAGNAATLPSGGTISIGQGTIVASGSKELVIKQNTEKLGINWQSFNVGADGRVVFEQPNANSVALNRVVGSDGSAILGKIDANGQVFLVNPNGVMFGKNAQVNVGGLVASTLDITDKNFEDGNYTFERNDANGAVTNQGTLKATSGGYVALIGKNVKNQGLIQATLGTAAMASGDSVTLDMSGDGLINLQVKKAAVGALLDNQGVIIADGGQALMTARAANALTETVINNDGIIRAQTINNKSGKIFLDGGPVDGEGALTVGGTLDASAPVSGDGGFIDTSAKTVTIKDNAKVTTISKKGKTGTWLIDPTDFDIRYGTGAQTASSIGITTLQNALASSNVTIETQSSGAYLGNIEIHYDLAWNANTTLTLTAHNNISTGYSINVDGVNGGLVLNYGGTLNLKTLSGSGKINLNGASSTLTQNGVNYTIIRNLTDLQNAQSDLNGHYAIGVNIDASASSALNGGLGFNPLGDATDKFTGSIFGLGHTITGLTINRPNEDYVGLIGYGSGNVVKDLEFKNSSISGKYYVGTIAGFTENSDFIRLNAQGTVSGGGYVGGLFGDVQTPTSLSWGSYNGTVSSTGDLVGGIAGRLNGSAYYLSSNGSVTGRYWTGGIAGNAIGTLHDSFSTTAVTGDTYVGGLVGYANGLNVYNTYSKGSVIASQSGGGLIGNAIGGSTISSSFSVSSVSAGGGLVGNLSNSAISNSYASGDVAGVSSGGLVGKATNSTIENSYATGKAAYGLVASSTGSTVTGSFWDVTNSGTTESEGGTGKTTAEMQLAATFAGWTIDATGANQAATWRIYEGHTGPLLTFMMPEMTPSSAKTTYSGSGLLLSTAINGWGGNPKEFWGTPSVAIAFAGQTAKIGGVEVINAGTYAIDGIYSHQFGWNLTNDKLTVTVNKKNIGYTTNGSSGKEYDGTTAVRDGFFSLTGIVAGDDVVYTASGLAYDSKNAGTGIRINIGVIEISGADAGNYNLSAALSEGTAYETGTIWKRQLTLVANGVSKTYDGTTSGNVNLSLDGAIVDGDSVAAIATSTLFSNKNAGSNKLITATGITLSGDDAANYALDRTAISTTADINKANLVITAVGSDKTYDGTTSAGFSSLTTNELVGDTVTISGGSAAFADKDAGIGKTVTVSGYTISGADADNYTWSTSTTTTATINKAILNVSASASDKTYDGTKNVSIALSDDRIGTDDLIISSSSEFADKNAGTGKLVTVNGITVTGADANNYIWNASTTTTADIAKAQLQIDASATNKTYDGSAAALSNLSDNRIAGDNLVISATDSSFSDKNAGTNKVVTVSGINVTGADAGNYDWNVTATTSADISKANLNVTASGVNKTYDASTAASATLTDDRILGDALSISYGSAAYADKNAGANKVVTVNGISVTGADAGNYIWNTSDVTHADIAKASLIITAAGVNKTYDGSTVGSAILSDNRFAGDDVVASAASSTFADKNAGAGKAVSVNGITVSGADAGNYTWNTTTNTTANIDKANLNVSATAHNKVYDATTSATVSYSDNRVLGDDLSISGAGTFSDKNAGSGKTVSVGGIEVTGSDAQNYVWNTTTTATADIAKATLTIGATGINRVYDGSTNASVVLGDDRIVGDDLSIAYTASFSDKNAGTGKTVTASGITVTGADAGNYAWNTTATTTANITKAALTISAVAGDKVYDGNTSASATLSDDRIAGDDLTIGSSASFSDKNAGNGKLVTVGGITLGGADAGNYTWNASTTATADITKANLVVSANGINKVYNGSTAADVTLGDNRVAGDDLILGSTASFSDKNAGSGKVVTASGITISGADANNYTWNTTATTTADIAKASLSISASGIDKNYDGNASASVNFADDRISGDDLTVAGAAQFSDKNAGSNKVITVGGIALSGADAGNYTWNASTSATANIAKAVLDISAVAENKTYDGTTVASVALSDDRVAGDDIVIDAAAHFSDKNAGQGKVVTVDGISLSGADAQNYTFNSATTASADIGKAALTISATGVDRTYDGSTKADVLLGDNRVSGDDISIDYAANFSDKNAGLNKVVTASGISVSGADAGNYTWNTSTTTTADIAKANLTIGATGVDRAYNGTTDADVVLSDDRIAGDDLSLSYAADFSDKNAGLNKDVLAYGINVTGADASNYVWNTTAATKADIAKATLSIAAAGANKTYDGSTSASVAFTDNRVLGDDLVISGSAAFGDKQAGNGKAVSVTGILLGGADAANYDWNTSASTIANIDKAVLNISAIAADKTYDGTTSASVTLGDDRVYGDDLVIGSSAHFGDKNAGNGKLVTVNGIVLSGGDADNYTFNTSTTATANINKASLTIGATGVDRVYNGSTNASVVLGDNRIAGDDLNLGYTASFSDKNAGNGKAVLASGITVSGADAGNYTWNTTASTTANIAKATLTVSGTVQDKVYDGSTQGSVGVLTDNRIAGDNLVISAAGATFADKNAGSKAAGIHGINVQGADAGNYEWNSVSTTVAEITKAFLNLAATGSNKTYDGTTAASVTLSDDRVIGDDLKLSFDSAQFADKNAGASKSITVSGITLTGEDAGNYTVPTSVAGQADIAKANLTVSASQQTKKQNASDPVLDWKVTQGSLFGNDSITGSLGRAPGESVGSYAINQGSLTAGGNYNLTFAPGLLNIEVSKPAAVTEVVADITGTKMQAAKLESSNTAAVTDYRLLNLGMKLPADEVFAPVDLVLTEEQKH